MDTNKLKKFAQDARNQLLAQVSAKLSLVLAEGSAARREATAAVQELERTINETSPVQLIEKVAYTWFNRFTALRFMDANGYTNPRIVTPADGASRPEVLADAAAGQFGEELPPAIRAAVGALLDGRTQSRDAQGEAYRLLLVAACNHWHGLMPYMFEKIADYTELLMPDDLLSPDSTLSRLRAVMTDEDCRDVEIIGWLYQFYISEKKDKIFADLKKNVKITAENIPAATQLFTPHWIVRYLVENSLGRLWLLNRPDSKLRAQMDYYIPPEQPERDFLRIGRPEEIRICDPACGSGHMLTYAFDLLHAIYEEEGYDPTEIPSLIMAHNLSGVEIDDRAGALAAFALVMKAAAKLGRRRFLRMGVTPDICVLQDVSFTLAEMQDVAAVVGKDLFTDELRETLTQFEQTKNFGSLIAPKLRDAAETLRVVKARDFGGDLLLKEVQERVLTVLRMAEALAPKYHVVVANPPYMGSGGMNPNLAEFAKKTYPDSKSDLFAMFMERTLMFLPKHGMLAMLNLPSWMFLSSFERLRLKLLENCNICSLVQCGRGLFGADFGTVAFCIRNSKSSHGEAGVFRRLFEQHVDVRKPEIIEGLFLNKNYGMFTASGDDFAKVPGSPIVYQAPKVAFDAFASMMPLGGKLTPRIALATGSNETFLRFWQEVSRSSFATGVKNNQEALASGKRWFPINKGGEFRKWKGNNDQLVDWENDGHRLKTFTDENTGRIRSHNYNGEFGFSPSITWSALTSSKFSARKSAEGFMFVTPGSSAFAANHDVDLDLLQSLLSSKTAQYFLRLISSTLNIEVGNISRVPVPGSVSSAREISIAACERSQSDWDAYETSWDFTTLPLLSPNYRGETLEATYARLRDQWQDITDEMQRLEEENNRIFIDAYRLQDELTPEVPIEEITLTCNPAYRYGVKGAQEDLETRLCADTMAEFLSYAVGCMFGRYSLDVPGLILANQGDVLADYFARVPEPTFDVDADNVIPLLDGDWFADDITERFRKFLRLTFGETHFQENLAFIEAALGKEIRKWFTREFFDFHVRRYKKRPIYWMFSSPKGSFNALIYLHRYRSDTVSVVLNNYLREFISKLQTERTRLEKLADDPNASQSQRTKAVKDVNTVINQIDELTEWERDVVFPLAQARIEIDLDDGVKRNYPRFGAALKAIKGLDASDDE